MPAFPSEKTSPSHIIPEASGQLKGIVKGLLENSPDIIFVKDKQGRYVMANDAAASWLGTPVEAMLGKTDNNLFPLNIARKIQETDQQVLQSKTPLEYEETIFQSEKERTLLTKKIPWLDSDSALLGVIGICRDVTEHKQLDLERQQFEQRSREAKLQLESALSAGSVYTWRWDVLSNLVTVNAAFAHLFGIASTGATTVSLPIEDFLQSIHRKDRARVTAEIQGAMEKNEVFLSEYRVKMTQNAERWVLARGQASYNESGEPIAFPGALADVTERKQAEEERDRFFELSRDMLAVANVEGYFIQVNSAWTSVLGYSRQEMLARPYFDFVHPDDRAATVENAEALSQGEPTVDFENRYRRKDGTYCWLEWSVTPFLRQKVLYAVAHDITHRKQHELERESLLAATQTARDEAERANRIKDDFLAVLSHELRTPLNPILAWAQILKRKGIDSEKSQAGLSAIERNARLQVQLVDDLLDVSRILRGKLTLVSEPVDLTEVVQNSIDTVLSVAELKKIQLKTDFKPQMYQVKGDSGRLQQVVGNLLSNAVKFTPSGGCVTVRLEKMRTSIQLQVTDTGKGIAADFLPHVFEHFRQADGTTTRKFGGLGLGLAIASKILEMHSGTISVDSAGEGQGATFTVVIPALVDELTLVEDSTFPVPDEVELPLAGLQLLVVDDEPDSLEVACIILEQEGAQVTAVDSATLALDQLSADSFDALICDIGMPEVDGYQLIEKVREIETKKERMLPAISLTAYVGDAEKERTRMAGFQAHIAKPVDATELTQQVLQLCKTNAN